ncbi:FliA/WhiG family RNA polymerase sigma factor [Bacillus sp. DNRA2]|nr:FliA/WhiG family RNA polymerase sigma factor [Bacillus sp. DNRA2]
MPNYSLWRTYRENYDSTSQEKLAKQYLHLVEQMANKLSMSIPHRIIPKEDLVGLGYVGLVEAIQKFDYKKGYQFETYGLWRIKGAMLDGIRKMDWVPRGLRDKVKKLNQAYSQLEQKLMRSPSEAELSNFLNITLDEVDQTMSVLSTSALLSLDAPINTTNDDGKQQNHVDQLVDESSISHERNLLMDEFRKLVADCIDRMPEKEKLVITLFYYEGLSQIEIAEVLSLTKGRISQLHSKAVMRMRQSLEAKGYSLDSFF